MSYAKQMQQVVREYRISGEKWPASPKMIAAWAIQNGRWRANPAAEIALCAREVSRAMREEYTTDSKGRRVRLKHPVVEHRDGEQIVLWDDIRTAPASHMRMSFQQRRNQIVGDCRQLQVDAATYNDLHADQPSIQIVFDFRQDLAELEAIRNVA
jgi:hypothetical protein